MRCGAFGQHQMMFLMMRTDRHHSEEAKPLDFRGIAIDDQGHAVFQVFSQDIPTGLGSEKRRVGRDHGANGLKRALSSPYLEPGSSGALDDVNLRFRGQQVHVDKVSTESRDIDRAPIGFRVFSEDRDDFGQGGEAGLAGLLWPRHRVAAFQVAMLSKRRGCNKKGDYQNGETHVLILREDDFGKL